MAFRLDREVGSPARRPLHDGRVRPAGGAGACRRRTPVRGPVLAATPAFAWAAYHSLSTPPTPTPTTRSCRGYSCGHSSCSRPIYTAEPFPHSQAGPSLPRSSSRRCGRRTPRSTGLGTPSCSRSAFFWRPSRAAGSSSSTETRRTRSHVFFERTISIQVHRRSPFSIWDWGQYHAAGLPDLHVLQKLLQALLVVGALAVFLVPRRKSPLQLAALTAVLLIGFEIVLTHWSLLYITWFYPFAALALLAGSSLGAAHDLGDTGARSPNAPRTKLRRLLVPTAGQALSQGKEQHRTAVDFLRCSGASTRPRATIGQPLSEPRHRLKTEKPRICGASLSRGAEI